MTMHLFKTIKLGPVNVTASRSGLSYSVGGRRARVGQRAGGARRASVKLPGGYRIRKG